jgi:hypothetical protein
MNRISLIALFLTLSGILHFVTAPERASHAGYAVALLYVVLGIFQLVLAYGVFAWKTHVWDRLVYTSCLCLLVLFTLNQLWGGQVILLVKEPYSLWTVLRKLFEILAGLLAFSLNRQPKPLR